MVMENSNEKKNYVKHFFPNIPDGQSVDIDDNSVLNNKHLTFTADLGGDLKGTIFAGHGTEGYSAAYLEITENKLRILHDYAGIRVTSDVEHGLNITGFITVNIDVGYGMATVTVMSRDGMYQFKGQWAGRFGKVFIKPEGLSLGNVKAVWFSDDYKKDIYMIGDSYFNTADPNRWPHYLIRDGYKNHFMTGYPGMDCARGLFDFKLSLERGTPKFAVWCVGMNNADTKDEINASYLATTSEFLKICRERGITPILSTIPSTPERYNHKKNEWVRAQGVRYIDFERAVGCTYSGENFCKSYVLPDGREAKNLTGYDWYPGMLNKDITHPIILGAQALYMQALIDFPEIMED